MDALTCPFPLIFEDNHLLVVSKPGGLLTQPSGTEQENVEDGLKNWIKKRDHKQGAVFLHALHRLDKPASGLVLFAKTSKALSRLNASIRNKEAKKIYLAWVEKELTPSSGPLIHWLVHADFQAVVIPKRDALKHPGAKEAKLHYRCLARREGAALIEIELETGRYHQIRCQLAAIGCPILGDRRYGSAVAFGHSEAIALHHVFLEITHPVTHQICSWRAEPPLEFGLPEGGWLPFRKEME